MKISAGPKVIFDFSEDLARGLTGSALKEALKEVIVEQGSLDAKGAAAFLSLSESEFRRQAKKHLPVINLGERSARFRIKDLIKYRDKKTVYPKK